MRSHEGAAGSKAVGAMVPAERDVVADRYDALLVDLDGVVYRGDRAVPRAAEVLGAVRERGIHLLFLTNNSSSLPEAVAGRLAALGVSVQPDEVLTSGVATATMLRRQGWTGATVFVIGEEGIRKPLAAAGLTVMDGEPDRTDLVVVGWDRAVDYAKLRRAALLVQRGARLVATNGDASYPAPDGLWPGAGSILAAVTTTTGRDADVVVGKPETPLFEAAARAVGARRPLVVGDRLETDVAGAGRLRWDSMLVLTGAATLADLVRSSHAPTYVGRDLGSLLSSAPPGRFREARADDAAGLTALLTGSGLSEAGVKERLDATLVCCVSSELGEGPVATACLDDLGQGTALLRSVAVRDDVRGSGLGALAVAAAARGARERGYGTLYLFTDTAARFFERFGFRSLSRDALPEHVRHSRQAVEECSVSAVPMELPL